MVGESGKEITVKERFAAGSIAGAIAQTAIFPMEVCLYLDSFIVFSKALRHSYLIFEDMLLKAK